MVKKMRKRVLFNIAFTPEQSKIIDIVVKLNRQSKHFIMFADVSMRDQSFNCAIVTERDSRGMFKALKELKQTTEQVYAITKEV